MKYSDLELSTKIILKVIFAGLVLLLLWVIRDILLLLLTALIIASAMEPLVDYLHHRKVPRVLSVLMVYVVFIGVAALIVYLMIPPVVSQFKVLVQNLPTYGESVQGGGAQSFFQNLTADFSGGAVVKSTFGVFNGALDFIAVLVISFYLVAEEKGMKQFISSLIPSHHHDFTLALVNKIQRKMGMWVLGQIIISFGIFIFTYIGLLLLHVQYALVLALVAGLFEIVPYIGPFISAIPAMFIAYAQNPHHPILVLWVAILYLFVHEFEGYVLVPKIMEKTVGTSPLLTLVALLVGYQLAGVVGLIISVPLATALSLVIKEFWPGREA